MITEIQTRRTGPGLLPAHRIPLRFAIHQTALAQPAHNPGGHHECEVKQDHEPETRVAVASVKRRHVPNYGRLLFTSSKGDVIEQLRALIRAMERRS